MGVPIIGATQGLSANAERIAEIISDFDETLELQWIPPAARSPLGLDKPYRIVQDHPQTGSYTVMFLEENELDHRVVAALFKARNQTITDIESEEAAKKAMYLRGTLDQQEAEAEFSEWALRQNKTVKHNGVVYR
jgi:hypothetical protein